VSHAGGQRGFTLLETLVSITIAGLTLSATFGVFTGGLRARAFIWDRHDGAMQARTLADELRAGLAVVTPATDILAGTSTTLSAHARGEEATAGRSAAEAPPGVELLLASTHVEITRVHDGQTIETTLPIRSTGIWYLDTDGRWIDRWDRDDALPRTILLTGVTTAGDAAPTSRRRDIDAGRTVRVDLPGAEAWP